MSFFDDTFPGVRKMLEDDTRDRNAAASKPWRVTGLQLGTRVVESEHGTRQEAEAALASILRTCAPFIRDSFRVEHR